MIIKKVTTGFVIQTYDTRLKRFVSQEFIAGECVYENAKGEPANAKLMKQQDGVEPYLPFDMRQPEETRDFADHELASTYADPGDRFVVSLIVTYADNDDSDPKTPQEAVAAVLALTTDDGSPGTQWYCYDRGRRKMHMIEQEETEPLFGA